MARPRTLCVVVEPHGVESSDLHVLRVNQQPRCVVDVLWSTQRAPPQPSDARLRCGNCGELPHVVEYKMPAGIRNTCG